MANLTLEPFLQQTVLSEQQMHHFKGQMHVFAVSPPPLHPNQLLLSFRPATSSFVLYLFSFCQFFKEHITQHAEICTLLVQKQHFMPGNLKILCFCDRLQVKKCLRKIWFTV